MKLKIQEGTIMEWVQQEIYKGKVRIIERSGLFWRVQPLREGQIYGMPKLASPDDLVQVES